MKILSLLGFLLVFLSASAAHAQMSGADMYNPASSSSTSLSLTTSGSSGASTLVGTTLNIPIYSGAATTALSALLGATTTNTIDNANNNQTWTWNTQTTQTALSLSSTSLTTGQLVSVVDSNAASTGYAGYFSQSATGAGYALYATETGGASNTGYAGYFSNTGTNGFGVYVNGNAQISKRGVGASQALSLTSTTFTPDFSAGNTIKMTLVHATCPCGIANPINTPAAGIMDGVIKISQSSTGSDTITWGSAYKFAGATAPTLSTGANDVDYFSYHYDASDSDVIVSGGILNAH